MTKRTVIERMADEMGLPKNIAASGLNALVAGIVEALSKGEKVNLGGLGTFKVLARGAKVGRNPRTGEAFDIPATHVVKFRPTEELKKLVGSITLLLVFLLCGSAWATQVHFQWNASTGAVAGYRLHQGTASGKYDPLKTATIPGPVTTGSMDMDPAASRFVAATAYDAGNRESAFSNEILCHPVLVSAGSGGTIVPSGTFFVQDGHTVTFTVAPAANHRVAAVTVNGAPISGDLSRAITVVERSLVAAAFELIPPPPPPTDLQLMTLQQIAADVARIAAVVSPEQTSE